MENKITSVGTPSPFNKMVLALVALLVVGGVGAAVYLNSGASPVTDESPPSLSAGGGGLKGSFVESFQGFLQYEDQDVADFAKVKSDYAAKFGNPGAVKGNAVTNYMTVNTDGMTMDNLVKNYNPKEKGNRALFIVYSAGQNGLSKGFHTYPVGPFGNATTEERKEDLSKIQLARNTGVIILSRSDTENYGVIDPSVAPSGMFQGSFLPNDRSGWILVSGSGKLSDLIGSSKDRLISAWGMKDATTFEKIENPDSYTFGAYHMVWLNLKTKVTVDDSGKDTPSANAPKIISVLPKFGIQGEKNKVITVTGDNLIGATVESFGDLELGPKSPATAKTLTFKINIDENTPLGFKELKITKGADSATDSSFEVKAPAPKITGITPSALMQGKENAIVTINGTNLTGATVILSTNQAVNFPFVGTVEVNDDGTAITINDVNVAAAAAKGKVKVTVTTPYGTANDSTFLSIVGKGDPAIETVYPASATQGDTNKVITITGSNLLGAKVTSAQDMTIVSQETATASTLVFKVNIAANAPVGTGKAITVTKEGSSVPAIDKSFEIKSAAKAPATMTAPGTKDVGDKTVTVTWAAPQSDSPITKYTITPNFGAAVEAAASVTSATFSSLTNDTAYTFTITATNATGTSLASPASSPVTPKGAAVVQQPATPAPGTTVVGSEVLVLPASIDGQPGYPGTYNGKEYQWYRGIIQNHGSLYDVKLSEGPNAGKVVYVGDDHIAAIVKPASLVVGQKVVSKSRNPAQNTFWSATIIKVDGANYTFGYDDETNKPEVRAIDNFFAPLKTTTQAAATTPAAPAATPATPVDENEGWNVIFIE